MLGFTNHSYFCIQETNVFSQRSDKKDNRYNLQLKSCCSRDSEVVGHQETLRLQLPWIPQCVCTLLQTGVRVTFTTSEVPLCPKMQGTPQKTFAFIPHRSLIMVEVGRTCLRFSLCLQPDLPQIVQGPSMCSLSVWSPRRITLCLCGSKRINI